MAEMPKITVSERKLMHHVTLKVTVKKDWRYKPGLWLIMFGAWLAGIGKVEVEAE